jgi:hypothetical protein
MNLRETLIRDLRNAILFVEEELVANADKRLEHQKELQSEGFVYEETDYLEFIERQNNLETILNVLNQKLRAFERSF